MNTESLIKLLLIQILIILAVVIALRFMNLFYVVLPLVVTVATIKIIEAVNSMVINFWDQKAKQEIFIHHKKMDKTFKEFHSTEEE